MAVPVTMSLLFYVSVFSREGGMKQKRFKGDAIAIAEAYRRRKRHEATDLWRDDEILEAKKLAKMINRAESDSKSSSKRTEHVTVCLANYYSVFECLAL